jgi:hypothetical protein
MTTKTKPKKQLLAAQRRKPEKAAVKINLHRELVAAFTETNGSITQADTLIVAPNICFSGKLLDVGGHATTASNGQSLFRLSHFICPTGMFFHVPINIVATAFSSTPCFLTVTHTILNHGADVEITVFAWDANGAPVPDILFDWRCLVALSRGKS